MFSLVVLRRLLFSWFLYRYIFVLKIIFHYRRGLPERCNLQRVRYVTVKTCNSFFLRRIFFFILSLPFRLSFFTIFIFSIIFYLLSNIFLLYYFLPSSFVFLLHFFLYFISPSFLRPFYINPFNIVVYVCYLLESK